MNDIFSESIKEKKNKALQFKKNLLYFRWLFLLFVIPVFLFISDCHISNRTFWKTFLVSLIYNLLVSLYIIIYKTERTKKIMSIFFYIDVMLVCSFSFILGGIESDIYLVLFFVISYYGISKNISGIVNLSIYTIILYSLTSIAFDKQVLAEFNYLKLVMRNFFILLTTYAVSIIVIEVNKYDEMHKKEFKLARTDKLTGLANRHYLDQKLEEEALYAEYSKKPLNVLMFDLDNFKMFNDTYGHVWGDKLLSLFGDIILQSVRKTDIPVRYGGEEFIILIRDLDLETAKSIGDRIRRQLEKQNMFIDDGDIKKRVTVSCGIAQFPRHSNDIKKVVEYADKALYYAKEIGKNIVVSYDEIGKLRETVQIDIETYLKK